MTDAPDDPGLIRVMHALGLTADALLGQGGEAWVLALDDTRIARVSRMGTTRNQIDSRTSLLAELGRSAASVPFAIPSVLDVFEFETHFATVEPRLPGCPLIELLDEVHSEARAALICAYLDAANQIGDLMIRRPWFGDLRDDIAVRSSTFHAYLEQRIRRNLGVAGRDFATVDPVALAAALPEPPTASFVHLDAFPGNILADGIKITAVLDFGASSILGDRRLDPLAAAVYLAQPITPTAIDEDRRIAADWLAEKDLADCYPAAERWLAAYWSFAIDDVPLHRWCRSVLFP